MESWEIKLYWWERPEDAHAIAQRVDGLLLSLASIDPELSLWDMMPTGKSREMIPFDVETFEKVKLGREGRSRTDDDGSVMEEFGYHAWLSTPSTPCSDDTEYSQIRIYAGAYGLKMHPNSCEVHLHNGRRFDALRTVDKQCAIIRALVEAWNPDYGLATSIDFQLERQPQRRARPDRMPEAGWLTYLPARRGPIPPLAPPAWTVPLGTLGSIVVASPERISVERPETIAAVDAVDAQLTAAGLLEPEPLHTETFLTESAPL